MQQYIYNIGSLFTQVAEENTGRVALRYPNGKTVTFQQLEALANKIAGYYAAQGLKKGDVIALFNNKTPLGYACMLAALKSGIIYTNLDLTSPYQRVKKILERCMPKMLLFDIDCDIKAQVMELGIKSVDLYDNFETRISAYSDAPIGNAGAVTGADGAYIMFTSGSTGFPKGAVITHANLINFIRWGQSEYGITQEDIFTNANPIYFDNSVFDFYISLFSGAQLVPLTNDVTRDAFTLAKAVANSGCTVWFSVPSLLVYLLTTKALGPDTMPSVKRFIFGGEGFPKPKLKKLFEMYGGQANLYNVYGPTECTCICSSYLITEDDFEDMANLAPLGYLAPNFSYELINTDESGRFGELCLKGPNVGAGYYNDKERTEKSFIQNPHNANYNEIVYQSGDLVHVDDIGRLHFKGRADNQVKHMGYRIELEEIESMLSTLEYVNEAAVIYERINDSLGQIVAFVSSATVTESAQVLGDLKQLVPEYMVPRKIHVLPQLPKNQNGKIDKVALKDIKKPA
ncbi:MAG: amino acid adenylation domain-containing protein [Bacteroidota bacterium]